MPLHVQLLAAVYGHCPARLAIAWSLTCGCTSYQLVTLPFQSRRGQQAPVKCKSYYAVLKGDHHEVLFLAASIPAVISDLLACASGTYLHQALSCVSGSLVWFQASCHINAKRYSLFLFFSLFFTHLLGCARCWSEDRVRSPRGSSPTSSTRDCGLRSERYCATA